MYSDINDRKYRQLTTYKIRITVSSKLGFVLDRFGIYVGKANVYIGKIFIHLNHCIIEDEIKILLQKLFGLRSYIA